MSSVCLSHLTDAAGEFQRSVHSITEECRVFRDEIINSALSSTGAFHTSHQTNLTVTEDIFVSARKLFFFISPSSTEGEVVLSAVKIIPVFGHSPVTWAFSTVGPMKRYGLLNVV
ncbi:unnamed protein product [Pleuronectes platessa]|uniref:Uncharacterized protein n=1 Tax=Pleuronectes platessa TaxID=8262 RepID=A0A9N7Z5M3_PLEPL|nr:unnamed protein product [Pleuronectes platessa]